MKKQTAEKHYFLCLSSQGYRASLIARRVYQGITDAQAEKRGLVRIVDESGEDYLYPAKHFLAIELPRAVTRAFRAAS